MTQEIQGVLIMNDGRDCEVRRKDGRKKDGKSKYK